MIKPVKTPAHVKARLAAASRAYRRGSSSDSSSAPRHLQSAAHKMQVPSLKTSEKQERLIPALDESNFDSLVTKLTESLQLSSNQAVGMLSTSTSADLLSISPIFEKPYDTISIDEHSISATDEELLRGIRNINYDITFSESPENSLAEEIAEIRKYSKAVPETFKEGMSMSKSDLDEFDPLMHDETAEVMTKSLIDESPHDLLLKDPLVPTRNDYQGFSTQTSKIQSISCETGNSPSQQNQKNM